MHKIISERYISLLSQGLMLLQNYISRNILVIKLVYPVMMMIAKLRSQCIKL